MNARELVQRETGLDLSQAVIDRAVAERMAATGCSEPSRYLALLRGAELQALTELLVVPESWMFRDPDAFLHAARAVRERIAAYPERMVRILSIPCAGGEEPYSMAMALRDTAVAPGTVQIDAIDLSEVALARAREGLYTRNAFRSNDLAFRDRHFTREGSQYRINDSLRDQVSFSQGNLLTIETDANVGRYDIIFCRNLLIYFNDSTAAGAIARLRLLLADDGLLFAGYAEVPAFCSHGFAPVRAPGAFALHKERRAVARSALAEAPPARPAPALRPAPRPAHAAPPPAPPARPSAAPAPATLLADAARLADAGELTAAATLCRQALAIDANAAEAYFILGMVSDCEQRPATAEEHWRRCIYLQPDHYQALCHLALMAEQRGDAAQATAFRQRAARLFWPPRRRRQEPAMTRPAGDNSMDLADCWNQIGVAGDQSCPKLAQHIHCRNCEVYAGAARRNLQRPVDAGYRGQWAALLRAPLQERTRDDSAALVFRVGREWLALPAALVDSVAPEAAAHRLPHRSGGALLGVVNVGGKLHPAISLATLLGIDSDDAPQASGRHTFARLVVVRWEGQSYALPAADLHGIVRYHARGLNAPAATINKGIERFLTGVLTHAGMHIGVLDAGLVGHQMARLLR